MRCGGHIFAGLTAMQPWTAFYIGQAASLADRIPNHERWSEARRLGATRVHARVVRGEEVRGLLEQRLIGALQPPLKHAPFSPSLVNPRPLCLTTRQRALIPSRPRPDARASALARFHKNGRR